MGAKQRRSRGIAVGFALTALASAVQVQAGTFALGDSGIEGRWSLGASLGAGWRARSADPALIGGGGAAALGIPASLTNGGTAGDGNDDGSLNYGKGDMFTAPFKLVGDLELKRDNLGAFVRAKAWYDFETKRSGVPHGNYANGYVPGAKLVDAYDDKLSKFSGAAIVDAYVFGDFKLGGNPVSVRLGNQVVNWGESLFIAGINQYGAFDIPAARRPGAQVKEILLPIPQIWVSAGVAEGLNVEAFYQFQWKKTVFDGCGTYWSPADGLNCPGLLVNPTPLSDFIAYTGGVPPVQPFMGLNARMDRLPDDEPSDKGQFGVAMRYYAAPLDTEFGAYYVNYHSRLPALGVSKTPSGPTSIWQAGVLTPGGSQYFWDYSSEDIKVAGLSASTVLGGWSVFGEVSRTRDLPVGLNGSDIVLGSLAGMGPLAEFGPLPPGSVIRTADRLAKTQLQVGTIKAFSRVLGAELLSVLGEVAVQRWSGIGDPNTSRRYGRGFSYGTAPFGPPEMQALLCNPPAPNAPLNPNPSFCEVNGFATRNAWGYRLFGELSYPDVIAGANFKPRVFFAHDVKGYSADGAFLEDRKTLSLGLRIDFRERYYLDVSATGYDRKAKYDTQRDRDFFAVVLGFNL